MRFCRLSLRHEGQSESVALSSPYFADVLLFAKSASYAVDDIGWDRGKMTVIGDLNGSLGSRQFLNVANEGTCFASCACRILHSFGIHFWLKSYLCFCRVWMKLIEVAKRFYHAVSGSFWSNAIRAITSSKKTTKRWTERKEAKKRAKMTWPRFCVHWTKNEA